MSIKDSAKTFTTRFKLDSHHAIERFGVFFGAIVVTGALVFGLSGASAFTNTQATLSSTALYTPSFTTSKTQISGDVSGVYVSDDRTRAMVFMEFSDTAQISANAEDYRAFLTASTTDITREDLRSEVTGSVYVFGSTGYMGVVLESGTAFPAQILDLTMRANTELVYKEGERVSDVTEGASFRDFDQWRLFFNPGGSEATVSPALSTDTIDVGAVYNELVIADKEAEVRAEMDSQLNLMLTDLNRVADGEAELLRATVDGGTLQLMAPEVPAQIANDRVTGDAATDDSESTLGLQTQFVMPLGYEFDWRNGSVADGYLKDLIPTDSNYITYLKSRVDEKADSLSINDMEWLLNDGTDLKRDYTTSSVTMEPLFEIMNNLSSAYQDYYNDKAQYQVDLYSELLDLEVELRSVEDNVTINDNPEALLTY
jgi:hypothetical protein